METLDSPELEVDNLKLENNDKEVSTEIETVGSARDNSIANNSVEDSSEKQEENSSTSNLVSMQDELVDTKEKTESEIISEEAKS